MGYSSRLTLVSGFQLRDRDVQIPHRAKMAVQPLQLVPYLRSLGVRNHRREEQDGRAQARQRDAHLIQRRRVAFAGRLVICGQIRQAAARYHAKRGVARHCWIYSHSSGPKDCVAF